MSAKRNNISQITGYLKGKLDTRVMHELERQAQDDPFLMDALDGFETTRADQQANLAELKTRLAQRVAVKKERSILLWRILPIAACLLIVFGTYWLFVKQPAAKHYVQNTRPAHHQNTITSDAKHPLNSSAKPVDSTDRLAKNIVREKPSPQGPVMEMATAQVYVNKSIAPPNNLIAKVNTKAYAGGDAQSAIKNLPKGLKEKIEAIDDYAYQPAPADKNKAPLAFGKADAKRSDLNGNKYLDSNLLSINTINKARNASANYYGASPAPIKNNNGNILVKGAIIDSTTGDPMTGATIAVDGKNLIQADVDGRYAIIVHDGATLTFNYAGYNKETVKLKPGQQGLDVKMQADTKALAETVIRGYVKMDKTTGSSYIITGKEVQDNPVAQVEELLQGKVAGLNIQNNTGAPGMRGSVNIRGLSSISETNTANKVIPVGYHLISGKIIDSAGTPLADASISMFGIGVAAADANGSFAIAVPPKGEFYIASAGYGAKMVEIDRFTGYTIRLESYRPALHEIAISRKKLVAGNLPSVKKVVIIQRVPGDTTCHENIKFRDEFLGNIGVLIKYHFEKNNNVPVTVTDRQYQKALKFLAKYVDLTKDAYEWHRWYEVNKCNNLK